MHISLYWLQNKSIQNDNKCMISVELCNKEPVNIEYGMPNSYSVSYNHCPCIVGTPYFVFAPDCPIDRTTVSVNATSEEK